ncbi:MAG: hypothetical protein LIP00_11550 [Parabacteroides sp.]|nr:hypothetical protein [Parabacteroides sp.]
MYTNTLLYYLATPAGLLRALHEKGSLCLQAGNLLHSLPAEEYGYGLAMLRKAIAGYEALRNLPKEKSKAGIPFFRTDRLRLVGPDTETYFLPFYESPLPVPPGKEKLRTPALWLGIDYEALADYCLFENASLFKCGYGEEQAVSFFLEEMETEYEKFGFDEEHTWFAKGSRLAFLLHTACSKWKEERFRNENEWRLTFGRTAEETDFRCEEDCLTPFFPVQLPAACLRSVTVYAPAEPLKHLSTCKLLLEKNGIEVNPVLFNG